jgi:hypothetical protein
MSMEDRLVDRLVTFGKSGFRVLPSAESSFIARRRRFDASLLPSGDTTGGDE